MLRRPILFFFFFFNDTATTEIYTLSLHDALPILSIFRNCARIGKMRPRKNPNVAGDRPYSCPDSVSSSARWGQDRKSTRLNSSHTVISYAVFCLKKKKKNSSKDSVRTSGTHRRSR